jgi:magnesium-protoporphyrin IX monomethyl ester (oxidative) cyclase
VRLSLINPPQIFSRYQVGVGLTPPLGIAYLAAYCREQGVDVEVVDALGEGPGTVTPFGADVFLRGLPLEAIAERVSPDADLIGISNLFSFAYPAVRELSKVLRARHPEKRIVMGGAHPTHMYEEVLRDGTADLVVLGEGEIPIAELGRCVDGKIALDDVPSLAYLDAGEIKKTRSIARLKDLDALPFPARDLLPMESYIAAHEGHGATSERWTSMITSRGCPYGCTFCDIRRTKWIARSAENVVDEIEQCIDQWGVREFHFEDDNLTLRSARMHAICDEILGRGLEIRWQTPNGIRASVTDEELLRKMRDSGCKHITLAPESGSERVIRDIIQKGKDYSHDELLELGRSAHKLGMKVAAYFVLGMPGEKPEDIEQTIEYGKRLAKAGVDEAGFSLLVPLPGTPVWDQVLREYGQPDYADLLVVGDLNNARSWSQYLTAEQLSAYRRRANLVFLLYRALYHPLGFARTVLNVVRGAAETKTENYMRTFIKQLRREPGGGVDLQSTAHYAYTDSALKGSLLVLRDFVSWLRGRRLPRDPHTKDGNDG